MYYKNLEINNYWNLSCLKWWLDFQCIYLCEKVINIMSFWLFQEFQDKIGLIFFSDFKDKIHGTMLTKIKRNCLLGQKIEKKDFSQGTLLKSCIENQKLEFSVMAKWEIGMRRQTLKLILFLILFRHFFCIVKTMKLCTYRLIFLYIFIT